MTRIRFSELLMCPLGNIYVKKAHMPRDITVR